MGKEDEDWSLAFLIYKILIKIPLEQLFSFVPNPPLVEPIEPNFANVKRGDHVYYKTPYGVNVHFYVTAVSADSEELGEGEIEVYGRFCEGNDDLFIEQQCLNAQKRPLASSVLLDKRIICNDDIPNIHHFKKRLYKTADLQAETDRLDEYGRKYALYAPKSNNSEHFVSFVKTGKVKNTIGSEFIKTLARELAVNLPFDILKTLVGKAQPLLMVALEYFKWLMNRDKASETPAENTTETKGVEATMYGVSKVTEAVKSDISKATEVTGEESHNVTFNLNKTVLLEVAVLLGSLINCVIEYGEGHMDGKEVIDFLLKQITASLGRGIVKYFGSLAGAAIGATIGSVCPVIGTFYGGVAGEFFGNILGSVLGNFFGRYLGSCLSYWIAG